MYNFLNMFLRKGGYALLISSFFFFMIFTKVYATDLNLPHILIAPNNYLFYSFVRLSEKALIFTKISKGAKVDYFNELIRKRLAELQYVVDNKYLGEVQQASQRLSYQIGILSDYININQSQLFKQKLEAKDSLNSYNGFLATLRDKYPANSSYWMLIQHDINSIEINSRKLN